MDNEDYYSHLGISRNASESDIKKAFRKMAQKYHPDKNPGDKASEEKFKKVQEAYDTLKDPKKRKIYDTYGKVPSGFDPNAYNRARQGGPFQGGDFSSGFKDVPFEDIFGDIFGKSGGGRRRPVAGQDIIQPIDISLEEALEGIKKSLSLSIEEPCGNCNSTGMSEGAQTRTCPGCGGSGRQSMGGGPFNFRTECSSCRGTGKTGMIRCPKCKGAGAVRRVEKVDVKIPPGVSETQKIRVKGKGAAGQNGGPRGNLYLQVRLKPHPKFEWKGNDLYSTATITFPQAVLGAKIEVDTLDGGKTRMTVPPGTQGGQKFRLKGKGLPIKGQTKVRGDQLVMVNIETPKDIDNETREIILELDRMLTNTRLKQ